jgi:NadR type nicotinamide-nucleotide adenylyltransferase
MERKSTGTESAETALKVVVIGPESTGKSTLCTQLAEYFDTVWCPEFAREYLLKNGMQYTYDDLLVIAKGQLEKEDAYLNEVLQHAKATSGSFFKRPLLFIDTDMYVMKVWCEFVFGSCHQWILEQIVDRKYDLYLLCNVDLPWQKDELREYPDLATREQLYHMYKDIMVNQSVQWADISGNYEERFAIAVSAVKALNR